MRGGGALTYWLNKKYPYCNYTLIDLNEDLLAEARNVNPGNNLCFKIGNIYELSFVNNEVFDLTCCWQTLSWLEYPERALKELVRITKTGGRLYLSALFNHEHDVDIYSKVYDWTRDSTKQGHYVVYNTYSMRTIKQWLNGLVSSVELNVFDIDIDLHAKTRGLGTYTLQLKEGRRLQVSAGMLLNWGILKIIK